MTSLSTAGVSTGSAPSDLERYLPALNHQAPFLIEKLLMEHIVETETEARALFDEVKRFIVLDRANIERHFQMYSRRVDEAWHQFVLFTKEYLRFCNLYFGRYVHHAPSNAPKPPPEPSDLPPGPEATFSDFSQAYQTAFGNALPEVWFDEKSLSVNSRLLNDKTGKLKVDLREDMVHLLSESGTTIFSASALAAHAFQFVANTGAFYVRELPGGLTDEEKVALAGMLCDLGIVHLGS